jgi:DNA primase
LVRSIPDDTIQRIKNAANIVDVISEYVVLKKAGRNHLGLCPFHAEKTPSFTVSPEKQMFYCFGCHVGGNVFSFLMQKEGLSFPDAVWHRGAR